MKKLIKLISYISILVYKKKNLYIEEILCLQCSNTGNMGMYRNTIRHAKQKPKLNKALEPSLPIFKNSDPITSPKKICSPIFK